MSLALVSDEGPADRLQDPRFAAALASIEWAREHDDEGPLAIAKRALFENFGLEAGFAVYRGQVDRAAQSTLTAARLESLLAYAESAGGAFRRSAASESFELPAPAVVGEGGVGPLAGRARATYVACLVDARVRAGSAVVEAGGCALFDHEPEEQADWREALEWDPAVFRAAGDEVWLITPGAAGTAADIPEAFNLLGDGVREFGHWLLEYIPKYVAAEQTGALPAVPLLIEAGLPRTFRQALELLTGCGSRIIELPRYGGVRLRRLWCAPRLFSFPVADTPNGCAMPPARYGPVIREMARRAARAAVTPTGADRVFLAREPPGPHAVLNQQALAALAAERGFRTVYPNRLDFAEQVRVVRHARFIAGPSGGAMYLAFFAEPGTRLCMFRDSGDVRSAQADMTGLFTAIGLDVTVFTGRLARPDPVAHNSDFVVDEAAFARFLEIWLRR